VQLLLKAQLLLFLLMRAQLILSAGMAVLPWQQQRMPCNRCWPGMRHRQQQRPTPSSQQQACSSRQVNSSWLLRRGLLALLLLQLVMMSGWSCGMQGCRRMTSKQLQLLQQVQHIAANMHPQKQQRGQQQQQQQIQLAVVLSRMLKCMMPLQTTQQQQQHCHQQQHHTKRWKPGTHCINVALHCQQMMWSNRQGSHKSN
jgi:hypothetical protein